MSGKAISNISTCHESAKVKSVDFVRDKIEMPYGMTTASVVFSADAIEGLPLATLLHMLGNGFCNHPKNKKTWRVQ